jgi:hypothetical protein
MRAKNLKVCEQIQKFLFILLTLFVIAYTYIYINASSFLRYWALALKGPKLTDFGVLFRIL